MSDEGKQKSNWPSIGGRKVVVALLAVFAIAVVMLLLVRYALL